jgi:hypothetical protein
VPPPSCGESERGQAVFNESAAAAFVQSVVGMPYGFHNFIYGFIDTPEQNFPPPLSSEFLAVRRG